jgi:hypothetical protein
LPAFQFLLSEQYDSLETVFPKTGCSPSEVAVQEGKGDEFLHSGPGPSFTDGMFQPGQLEQFMESRCGELQQHVPQGLLHHDPPLLSLFYKEEEGSRIGQFGAEQKEFGQSLSFDFQAQEIKLFVQSGVPELFSILVVVTLFVEAIHGLGVTLRWAKLAYLVGRPGNELHGTRARGQE